MASKILLIESDAALARQVSAALGARGVAVAIAPDGRDAAERARAERPDAIVLAAELPSGSGFVVCNKLRKEQDLRTIPLLLTSADATEDTFEQHRKLRTRADAYLRKPFDPATLVERLHALVPLPGAPAEAGDVEIEVIADADDPTVPPRPAAAPAALRMDDDDLAALDAAFDQIAQADDRPGAVDHPVSAEEAEEAASLLPELGALGAGARAPAPLTPPAPPAAPHAPAARDRAAGPDAAGFAALQAERDALAERVSALEALVARHEERLRGAAVKLQRAEAARAQARQALAAAVELLGDGSKEG